MSALNPQQTAAVNHIHSPLLVLAGAGSGKTRVIIQKIVHLIDNCSYPAPSICALTFTNKAAREMQHRLQMLLPSARRRGLVVSTFHALGLRIIKREVTRCGLRPSFSIFDAQDCLQILRGFLPRHDRDFLLPVQQQIATWKNALLSPEQSLAQDPEMGLYYQQYQKILQSYNALDFDDLITLPVTLLQQDVGVLTYWQQKFRHILVDEYQDSNTSQYQFLLALVGSRAKFTAVGDSDQSIYAWRGAKPENLRQLQRDFPDMKVITLEQNYRSTGQILALANQLITHNPQLFPKKLWSEYGPGDTIRVLTCQDEQSEAEMVINDLIGHKFGSGKSYSDYAILYRSNHQARIFETVFRARGIPYHVSGGQAWFARTEVKDWFAYIKLLVNETDDAAFLRAISTPKRGIGETSLLALADYAKSRGEPLFTCCDHLALTTRIAEAPRALLRHFKQSMLDFKHRIQTEPIVSVLREMLDFFAYEVHIYEQADSPQQAQKRMDNVWQLLDWIGSLLEKKPDNNLPDVLHTLILMDILDKSSDDTKDQVQLMTLHAAKGLEFRSVYLVGMVEGVLPHHASMEDAFLEEERRLAYVGITRAERNLTLSLFRRQKRGGELVTCDPSRFLEELEGLEWQGNTETRDPQQSKTLAQAHLAALKTLLRTPPE